MHENSNKKNYHVTQIYLFLISFDNSSIFIIQVIFPKLDG